MKANYQNRIEAYLSGEMNADQLSKFEVELGSNPELNQELNFQSEIIQGIGEYRKIQLLARMDALKVPSAWWSTVQNSLTFQYIGAALITAMIGTGIWFAIQDDSQISEVADLKSIEIDAPVQKLIEWNLPEKLKVESRETVANEKPYLSSRSEEVEMAKEKSQPFIPVVAVPSAGNIEAGKTFVPEEVVEPSEVASSNSTNHPISVEILDSKALKVKYSYYDGKLFLYGKFQQQPYEILEINSAKERKIYLYHLEAFYEILPSDKPLSLQAIADVKLIQELTILRKAK